LYQNKGKKEIELTKGGPHFSAPRPRASTLLSFPSPSLTSCHPENAIPNSSYTKREVRGSQSGAASPNDGGGWQRGGRCMSKNPTTLKPRGSAIEREEVSDDGRRRRGRWVDCGGVIFWRLGPDSAATEQRPRRKTSLNSSLTRNPSTKPAQ